MRRYEYEKRRIKGYFLKYNCNISSLLRDNGKLNSEDVNVIFSNADYWVKEFFEINANIMEETNNFSSLAQAFSKYKFACKSYEEIFNLSRILKGIIKETFYI